MSSHSQAADRIAVAADFIREGNHYGVAAATTAAASHATGTKIDIGDNNNATTPVGPYNSNQGVSSNNAATHIVDPSLLKATARTKDLHHTSISNGVADRRVKFKSLLESGSTVINDSDASTISTTKTRSSTAGDRNRASSSNSELIDLASFSGSGHSDTSANKTTSKKTVRGGGGTARHTFLSNETIQEEENELNSEDSERHEHDNFFDDDYDDEDDDDDDDAHHVNTYHDEDDDDQGQHQQSLGSLSVSPSHHRLKTRNTIFNRLYRRLRYLGSDLSDKITSTTGASGSSSVAYTPYEDTSAGNANQPAAKSSRKYKRFTKARDPEQNFRGPYRYSRIGIVMTVFRKLLSFLFQRATLALFGAFLIHVTLGTIYTLSNINSYLTSYMRKHGSPNATYGGSMWISSSYAVGQGISMVLGGLIERRFSARVSCIIGCALHSLSIMSTSKAVDYGQLAVLLTYGFLPGFGCGLAYMTPMSNGFGWFPHRKGLVAGVILAGFGIGTFVFNMAQTAYVNPNNLSPPKDSGGYFTQDDILNNVPHLFTFLGTIYAAMQFVGCCLLFKPPPPPSTAHSDERPILAEINGEMSFRKALRSREFIVLFLVFGITNQGVLFVNSMLKEYGQLFIADDLYLAWTGSMASIANSLGRLVWGMAIDRFSFTQCFTSITTIFGTLIFLMPFEFILSSKLLYLLCTLGIFGSFSGWMSTYPVHLSRIFGLSNSGMIYGLIFVSQSLGGILTAFAAHYLIDQYSRFVPFFCVTFLEVLGLAIYHLFYENK